MDGEVPNRLNTIKVMILYTYSNFFFLNRKFQDHVYVKYTSLSSPCSFIKFHVETIKWELRGAYTLWRKKVCIVYYTMLYKTYSGERGLWSILVVTGIYGLCCCAIVGTLGCGCSEYLMEMALPRRDKCLVFPTSIWNSERRRSYA